MGKLDDKIALLTGATSGVGLASAHLFRAEGARLVVTGRDEAALAGAVRGLGGDTLGVRADAASLADIDALVAQVQARFGRLDVLFINAGTAIGKPVAQVSEADFDAQCDVNFKGVFFMIQKALPKPFFAWSFA